MKHKYCAESDSILIRPLKRDDLEYLRSWRNDKKLSTYLRDIPYITEEAQGKWFEEDLTNGNTLYFANSMRGLHGRVREYVPPPLPPLSIYYKI